MPALLTMLTRARRMLVRALEVVVVILMAVLVLDVIWQVATRLASNIPRDIVAIDPSRWTDELAVMLMIWVALLGAGVAFDRRGHLGVDFFVARLPAPQRKAAELLAYVICGLFAGVCMLYGGLVFVSENTGQLSPALDLPMSWVFCAVPISGAFFLLISIEAFFTRLAAPAESHDGVAS